MLFMYDKRYWSSLCTGQIRRKTETQSHKAKIPRNFGIRPVGLPEVGDGGRTGVGRILLPKILMTKANPLKDGDAKLRD